MRRFLPMLLILLASLSIRAQEKSTVSMDWEVYKINQFAISHSYPVSFSVGYPKGWSKCEASPPGLGASLTLDEEPICSFWSRPPRHDSGIPGFPPSSFLTTNWATIFIFRSFYTNAAEAAESFTAAHHQPGKFTRTSLTPVTTKAGDSGLLALFNDTRGKGQTVHSVFFFHVGPKGAIRISLSTKAEDSGLREQLQHLVLETLRFDQPS